MKQFETSGAACLGQNLATAQPRNSAGNCFAQSQFDRAALRKGIFTKRNFAGGMKRNSADMHGKIGICQEVRKHKERVGGFCPRWFALVASHWSETDFAEAIAEP